MTDPPPGVSDRSGGFVEVNGERLDVVTGDLTVLCGRRLDLDVVAAELALRAISQAGT